MMVRCVSLVIGRPNVMELLILWLLRIAHSYNIHKILTADACYITPSKHDEHLQFPFEFRLDKFDSISSVVAEGAIKNTRFFVHEEPFINAVMLKNVSIAFVFLIALVATIKAQHKSRRPPLIYQQNKPLGLHLPDNATSIRENIVDTFSCDNRIYGYYADVDNECQIFHICVPQARRTTRYSFICPAETVFDQLTFVCTRTENSIPCAESEKYYYLNERFGKTDENTTHHNGNETDPTARPPYPGQSTQKPTRPAGSTQYPTRPTTPSSTTPDYWTTQSTPHGSTQYPTRPTNPTTTSNNWNPQGPARPPTTTPGSWTTQYPQKPTQPPGQHTSTPSYPTTQYPNRPTRPPTRPPITSTPDWLTTQYPSLPTRPPTYPPSSSSTPDYWASQRPPRPTRPPNRPTTTPNYWTTQYPQRPPRPTTQSPAPWQYVDDEYANY